MKMTHFIKQACTAHWHSRQFNKAVPHGRKPLFAQWQRLCVSASIQPLNAIVYIRAGIELLMETLASTGS